MRTRKDTSAAQKRPVSGATIAIVAVCLIQAFNLARSQLPTSSGQCAFTEGGQYKVCLYTDTGTYTVNNLTDPAGVSVTISLWGAGGAGSGVMAYYPLSGNPYTTSTSCANAGGGGSGAAVVNYPIAVGSQFTITSVGQGGSGGAACNGQTGGDGGETCVVLTGGYPGAKAGQQCGICVGGGFGGTANSGGRGGVILGGASGLGMCPNVTIPPQSNPTACGAWPEQGPVSGPYSHSGSSGGVDYKSPPWNEPCILGVGCGRGSIGPGMGGAGAYGPSDYQLSPHSGAGGYDGTCRWNEHYDPRSNTYYYSPGGLAIEAPDAPGGGVLVTYAFPLVRRSFPQPLLLSPALSNRACTGDPLNAAICDPNAVVFCDPNAVVFCYPNAVSLCVPNAIIFCDPNSVSLCVPNAVIFCDPNSVSLCVPNAVIFCDPNSVSLCVPNAVIFNAMTPTPSSSVTPTPSSSVTPTPSP